MIYQHQGWPIEIKAVYIIILSNDFFGDLNLLFFDA